MIQTEYASQTIYLLEDEPDWVAGVTAEISLLRAEETGLTDREGRRPHSQTLRLRTKFTVLTRDAAARALQGGLQTLTTEPVVVPLWPAVVRWADRAGRAIGGGLNIAFKPDFSQFEIYEGSEPGWPAADDLVAPLLWGRLQQRKLTWLTAEVAEFVVDHVESSPANWAVAPGAVAFGAGPNPGTYGTAPRLFPYEMNFGQGTEQELAISILREEIGFGRELAETFYPQAVAREQDLGQSLTSAAQAGGMLEFFRQHGGGKVFWVPDWIGATRLTAGIGPADTVLNVEDTEAIGTGQWLALLFDGQVKWGKVTGKTADTVTVAAAPGAAPSYALVTRLLLAKLRVPKLSLQWRCNEYAEARLQVREMPAEYVPASDETLGTTIGVLPTRGFLYRFSRMMGGTTMEEYYTSFENDVFYIGPYTAKKITHGDIKQGLLLDADAVEIKSDVWAGNPLVLMATLRAEVPLFVKIYQADIAAGNGTNVELLFSGEVVSAQVKGSRITAKAVPGGTVFDRRVPRVLFQRGCNNAVFDAGCALDKADWGWTATMVTPGSPGYPFEFDLEDLTAPMGNTATVGLNFFALGWIEIGSTGPNWQARAILLSTVPSSGDITVTLDRDPYPFPAGGESVKLFPGCDGSAGTCQVKFDNYLNFLGHPFLPVANPSLVKKKQTGAGGKK